MRRLLALSILALAIAPRPADGFCGFYVGGADAKLFNNATMVVMMRDGTRTVLSMQNNYQGPPSGFAMVVPVPVVLQKENVKTLPREVFDKIDTMAAPRLVEYWETDPCYVEPPRKYSDRVMSASPTDDVRGSGGGGNHGVKVEAQFTVGEYDIVILSASDSSGLETWLTENKYAIPAGAEPLLRPYVAEGSKFFVAKVDPSKVTFKGDQAMLSPLRFHYDTEDFRLPVRLGLINSAGTQDLIVHILARNQRYQVANYKNVTIPTNLDVAEDARGQFGAFYAALFDATLEKNPGAVVTEYAWAAGSCDPCPGPTLDPSDIATFGGDVIANPDDTWSFVLTRLHARYGKDALGEDLVFEAAPPIVGGRERWKNGQPGPTSEGLEHASNPDSQNNFQGRYIIRHPWTGKIDCKEPVRWRWGGPPGGRDPGPAPAKDLAFAERGGVKLAQIVRQDVPELDLKAAQVGAAPAPPAAATKKDEKITKAEDKKKSCGCGVGSTQAGGLGALLLVGLSIIFGVRRRSRR